MVYRFMEDIPDTLLSTAVKNIEKRHKLFIL